MTALLLLALLQDASIESVRAVTGGAARSGCWLPVEVLVRGPYQGEVVVIADAGVRFIRECSVPAGSTGRVVVPVVVLMGDARVSASLGRTGARVPMETPIVMIDRDLLVGDVGGRLVVEPLDAGRSAYRFPFNPADWTEPGLAEALDVVVGDPGAAALELFRAHGGRVVPAGTSLATIPPAGARFESVDALAAPLLDRDPWIATKREKASLVIALYFLLLVCAMAWLGSRKAALWMLAAVIVATSAIFAMIQTAVPRGDEAVVAWEAEAGDATARLVWIRSTKAARSELTFVRLAKPVFATYLDAQRADFDLVMGETTRVRQAALPQAFFVAEPRMGAAAVSVEPGPWVGIANESPSTLKVHALIGNLNGYVGELAPRDRKTAQLTTDEPAPGADDFRYFAKRLVRGDCIFGWYHERDRVHGGVDGPEVAERRAKPRFFVVMITAKGGG